MSSPLNKLEPLIWFLFGQGIMIGTILMTGWLLVVGLAMPLELVPADALDYPRAHGLASSLIGRVVLFSVVALPMWKGAHHMRHFFIDMGHSDKDAIIGSLCYVLAIVGNVMALMAVISL